MRLSRSLLTAAAVFTATSFALPLVAEEPLALVSPHGAAITLSEANGVWQWTRLHTPSAPENGWPIVERASQVATAERTETLPAGWTLVETDGESAIFEQTIEPAGLQLRRIFRFGAGGNTLRIETSARSLDGPKTLARIALLDVQIDGEGFRETGVAPASFPLLGTALFAGIEHISGEAQTAGDTLELMQRPRLNLDDSWRFVAAAIVGWTLPGHGAGLPEGAAIREAFLQYLDTVRVKPDRMVLHSETWWTMMPPLREPTVLADIEALRRGFFERTGMFFDTYCLDLGWSNPRTFWQIETRNFPNEFRTINERLNALGCRLGLWMSPSSGYPDGLHNDWLQAQGYELLPFPGLNPGAACFALGGRYQREFKERIVGFAQQYGLGHAIFDFMAYRCDVAAHGHPVGAESRYAIDAGVADVLDSLRAVNPNIALEPMVCGYPPSPWWLMKTAFILGPAGDDIPYGRGPCPDWLESLITARDTAYRTSQEAWLMPTQALETWDIILQTPGKIHNTAVMAIGRGRWFLSSYIKPDLMQPEDWDFFAALVRWARHNKQYLVNAWMFGGEPGEREAYGYLFRNAAKDVYCVRNPWIAEQTIELPLGLSVTEPRDLRMIYPRRATIARIEPGSEPVRIAVAPYETLMLETVPVDEAKPITRVEPGPVASVADTAPRMQSTVVADESDEDGAVRYSWGGTVTVPEVSGAELCVLVQGGHEVERALCRIAIDGREVEARKLGSAGQFAAALEASPDNWTWFIVPMPKGEHAVQIDLTVFQEEVSLGAFLRGAVPAESETGMEGDVPLFPLFKPTQRAWSHTLLPVTAYPGDL